MKKLFVLLFMLSGANLFAQDSLQSFRLVRNKINITGMKVLGSWGIVNIGVGVAGRANTDGAEKYFYQMNSFWGATNLGIAAFGFFNVRKNFYKPLTAEQNLKAQKQIEKTFLINCGLDVVYTGTGIYLRSRGNNRDDDKLKGYGSSVMLQGIFLLVFDGVMYKLQKANGDKLKSFLEKNSLVINAKGIGMIHSF